MKDNFSSALLHYKSTNGKAGSEFIRELFQETFEKYSLFDHSQPIHILSDGGTENKGLFLEWLGGIKAPPIVTKLTARSDKFPFSNSMSEITHRLYKSTFMNGRISKNESEHLIDIAAFFHEYNNHWYLGKNFGYTAMEVLNGKVPDKNRFKEQIRIAQKQRLTHNQNVQFCVPKVGCKQ